MKIPYYLQINYAKLIGNSQIDRFEVTKLNPFGAVGRCPICGDSQKSKVKTRFTFYSRDSDVFVYCHNCSYSTSLIRFIKERDEFMYRQLLADAFAFEKPEQEEKKIIVKYNKSDNWKRCLTKVSMVPAAKKYLDGRKIPSKSQERLFYTTNLKHTYVDICTEMNLEVDSNLKIPEIEGIFIPFLSKDGILTFSNTRNMDETSTLRYVTVEFQPSHKIFGLEVIDESRKVFVTEGPIDSLFLDNCIATGDASLDKAVAVVKKDNLVLIPDNEPRAPVQTKKIKKFIDMGYEVVLFPEFIKEKDINEMVKVGIDVNFIVSNYSYKGLKAKMEFAKWCKA